jgi:D-3-phosphoglycerate dehydrogenase
MTVQGRWREGRPYVDKIPRLYGQTIGLISFGNVAKAVARRCHAFGLHVIAYDPYVAELEMTSVGVEPVTSLIELCRRSDFVSMHAPLNAETRHLMSTAQFQAMKPSAIFVNNGRGPSVDEAALIKALQDGTIAGAALDVFEEEPVATANPLLKMDNVIVTPHIASATARMAPETRRRLGREIATVLQGRWPRSAVNPGVLPRTTLIRWQPYPMGRGPNR